MNRLIPALLVAATTLAHGQLKPASLKHVFVYKEPGRFAGWPANNGIAMIWGNEIVVAFARGWYKTNASSHSIDGSKETKSVQARSLDGGETWAIEEIAKSEPPVPSQGNIRFNDPNFGMRIGGDKFSVTYDRARTWKGPYLFTPPFTGHGAGLWPNQDPSTGFKLSSRTDYLVIAENECLFFLSGNFPEVNGSNHGDRSFMARTRDGGKSFQFVSWLTGEPVKVRAAMPSTARTSPTRLVSITRRKVHDTETTETKKYVNWIEASVSEDNGESWKFLTKVADTDRGEENGNPPALIRMRDGRLVVAYGYRSKPFGMRAKVSNDGGKTWGEEIVPRNDGATWDFGYARMVQRPDGKLVTIYYYNTPENPEQHIVATIWDPPTEVVK